MRRRTVTQEAGARPAKAWAPCERCGQGVLLPLSDYGPQGNDIPFKVWVCHHPGCGFYLRIDNGQVSAGQPVPPARTKGAARLRQGARDRQAR